MQFFPNKCSRLLYSSFSLLPKLSLFLLLSVAMAHMTTSCLTAAGGSGGGRYCCTPPPPKITQPHVRDKKNASLTSGGGLKVLKCYSSNHCCTWSKINFSYPLSRCRGGQRKVRLIFAKGHMPYIGTYIFAIYARSLCSIGEMPSCAKDDSLSTIWRLLSLWIIKCNLPYTECATNFYPLWNLPPFFYLSFYHQKIGTKNQW